MASPKNSSRSYDRVRRLRMYEGWDIAWNRDKCKCQKLVKCFKGWFHSMSTSLEFNCNYTVIIISIVMLASFCGDHGTRNFIVGENSLGDRRSQKTKH